MSANLQTLLTQAAMYRAAGHQWSEVAKKLNRRTRTCQNWPVKHPALWRAVYNEAQAKRFEQLGNETYTHLTNLLRHSDPQDQCDCRRPANEVLGPGIRAEWDHAHRPGHPAVSQRRGEGHALPVRGPGPRGY